MGVVILLILSKSCLNILELKNEPTRNSEQGAMMQWIPNRYRKNEIRLRYTKKAYCRGMSIGFGLGLFCCINLFMFFNIIKLVLT